MKESIISVGIDLGTSTTQVVFSKLTIDNLSSDFAIPKINIVEKEVIYRSDIYFTPLLSNSEIDAKKMVEIISVEYKKAGIIPSDVSTGAVIITGETARKDNASQVLEMISEFAGDFVVATAGPDLESILSGKGAGADKYSEANKKVVANLDIGGGTTNMSVFASGDLVHVSCLDIGGRLIKVEHGKISYIYHKIMDLAAKRGLKIRVGDVADEKILRAVCDLMAEMLAQLLRIEPLSEDIHKVFTNNNVNHWGGPNIEEVTFSGGVASILYNENQLSPYEYGDIGVLLADAIKGHQAFEKIRIHSPEETMQATVVGAGTHTTKLSGSTIRCDENILPLKNLPVIRIDDSLVSRGSFQEKYRMLASEGIVVMAMQGLTINSFKDIQSAADMFIQETEFLKKNGYPIVIMLESDYAKSLGNAIKVKLNRMGDHRKVVCVDNIAAFTGDYVDLGEPLGNGRVLPVIVKTLVFNT